MSDTEVVVQKAQRGTADAVLTCKEALAGFDGSLLVLSGDCPLITPDTIRELADMRARSNAAVVVLTMELDDPFGYGRIIRDGEGRVERIVEQKDANAAEVAVTECNSGFYCFDAQALFEALEQVGSDNAQGEFYLTDVLEICRGAGRDVLALPASDVSECLGVNSRVQLAAATCALQSRINKEHMAAGVTMWDPTSVWIGPDVEIAPDVELLPQTFLLGKTQVGEDSVIGPNTRLTDTVVGSGCTIDETVAIEARIDDEATCGPRAYLRPGAHLCEGAKAGTHVAIKKSTIGRGSKVSHPELHRRRDARRGRERRCRLDHLQLRWRQEVADHHRRRCLHRQRHHDGGSRERGRAYACGRGLRHHEGRARRRARYRPRASGENHEGWVESTIRRTRLRSAWLAAPERGGAPHPPSRLPGAIVREPAASAIRPARCNPWVRPAASEVRAMQAPGQRDGGIFDKKGSSMKRDYPHLCAPLTVGRLTLRNRMLSAPMGATDITAEGTPGPRTQGFYELRAKGGAAVVTVSELVVHPETDGSQMLRLSLKTPGQLGAFTYLADAIKRHGAVASIELSHSGQYAGTYMVDKEKKGDLCQWGPSDGVRPDGMPVRALSHEQIASIVAAYGEAAALAEARRLPDGHGACGARLADRPVPLPLLPASAARTNTAGPLENRIRFAREVLAHRCAAPLALDSPS